MKSLRNKVVLSAVVLAFALIATIGSTYAWFTVSDQASVSGVQLNVKSSDSLLIRVYNGESGLPADEETSKLLDATTYSSNITYQDIIAKDYYKALATNDLAAARLTPVTAAVDTDYTALNAKDLKLMDIDSKVLSNTNVNGNSATGEYVDIKFWLLSQGEADAEVVLDTLSITANNSVTLKNVITNAVNVAVWESGHSTVASTTIEGVTTFGITEFADTDTTSDSFIFSLDPDYAFAFTTGMKGFDTVTAANNSIGTSASLVDLHSLFAADEAVAHVSALIANATTVVTLTPLTPTLVTVRIYVEGWDAQTTNTVLAAVFSVSFKFSLKPAVVVEP